MANETPKTLQEAIVYFSNPTNCRDYFVARRWPNGVTCPRCGSESVTAQPKYNRWQCSSHHASIADKRRQFTLKTGTIFEDSPLGLDKWLTAVWMITSCKNGVSSYEIHRAIGVTQKTAWFMLQRIRLAMQSGSFEKKLSGHVEVDETFIGGKARNMHKARKERAKLSPTGMVGKIAVMGLLERRGEVRTQVVPATTRVVLQAKVREHVEAGSSLYSDSHPGYDNLEDAYIRGVINHAEKYVDGLIHTNGLENFWSLLKRTLKGTYVSVEPFHLFRYLDEQSFRFNNRKGDDKERFFKVMGQVTGKRVTYKQLTGKNDAEASSTSH